MFLDMDDWDTGSEDWPHALPSFFLLSSRAKFPLTIACCDVWIVIRVNLEAGIDMKKRRMEHGCLDDQHMMSEQSQNRSWSQGRPQSFSTKNSEKWLCAALADTIPTKEEVVLVKNYKTKTFAFKSLQQLSCSLIARLQDLYQHGFFPRVQLLGKSCKWASHLQGYSYPICWRLWAKKGL